ncbi:MAG TPA: VIT and VWA domain-containing protein [Planctomycetota bacterium]|nr:VIT and VWA domain-containing protein [Planctomycetota bacterium]
MRYCGTVLLLLALASGEALAQGIVLERLVPDTTPPPPVERREPWAVELIEHRVKATIEDQAAVFEITQVFRNPNAWPGEGIYLFPLPEGASVSRFTMSMGGKDVPGEILDANRARDIYLSIVQRRKDPGLLEYAGRGLIRARLFPIPARGDTTVTLRYEQLLPSVGGLVELCYPLRADAFGGGVARVSGSIDVRADAGVGTVFSPSHALDVVRQGDGRVVASFEERASRCDRDLRVLWGLGRGDVDFHLASTKPAGEDGYFLMLLTPNRAAKGEALSKDIVFVLDTSGSMGEHGGEKIRQAKAALGYALGRLGAKDRFNVVAFATAPRPFRDGVVEASPENVKAAIAFVDGLEATGGTAIHDALVAALKIDRAEGRVPIVFFLTDGEATVGPVETPAILSAVEQANKAGARIFSFGVGDDLNATLLTDLAARTRGNALFVSEKEGIEIKASALFDQVASPVLTDVTLSVDGADVHDVHPARLQDLFKGQQVSVVGRYTKAGACAVTLKGRLGGEEVSTTYDARFTDGPEREYLPRLWAMRQVGFLLGEIRAKGESKELVDEVRRLGTRYGIVTPYTSFLVVEEERMLRERPGLAGAPPASDGRGRDIAMEALDEARAEADAAKAAYGERQDAGGGAVAGAKMAKRLAEAESGTGAGVGLKTVGDKTFRLVDGVWEDTAIPDVFDGPVVRAKCLSDEYLDLLKDTGLARYLSVGTRVRVLHGGTIYEIGE